MQPLFLGHTAGGTELHPLVAEFLDRGNDRGQVGSAPENERQGGQAGSRQSLLLSGYELVGGSVEEELDAIRQCIRMQQRYDAPRLRYGK